MAMRGKKLPKEVQAKFDKYMNSNVRKLTRDAAIEMLHNEFGLEKQHATDMFDSFDKDKNGTMSLWEFQQFYQCVGERAQAIVAKFEELDADKSGKLDLDEARAGLQAMQTGTGRNLEDKEIAFFLKTTVDDNGQIDLAIFANLMYRLTLYKAPAPK